MTDGAKTLIGSIAALAALVACFAIMANCSENVARIDGQRAADCVQSGGQWHDEGVGPQDPSYCERGKK